MIRPTTSVMWAVLLMGCGKNEPDTGDDSAAATTIYALNQGEHDVGSTVQLRDVVVSAPPSSVLARFYIQEEAGGAYSGIRVVASEGASLPQVELDARISLTATFTSGADGLRLELGSADQLEVSGMGSLTPEPLNADSDWGPWKGVLVQVADLSVLGCPNGDGVDELSSGLTLDDALSAHAEPTWLTSFATITGPVDLEGGAWTLYPRSDDDLGTQNNVASCAAVAAAEAVCDVTLAGLVATTPNERSWGGFFAQDPGGGEHSGLWISNPGVQIEAGQVFDVSGTTSLFTDSQGGYVTLEASTALGGVVVSDQTATPIAAVLDSTPSDWSVYESSLVTLQGVEITGDPDNYWWIATDMGVSLTAWLTTPLLRSGDSCTSITGVPTYWGDGYWTFSPRSAEELDCESAAPEATTISGMRQGEVEGLVTIEDVVVTSWVDPDGIGFFAQDPGGGEYAGTWIYYTAAGSAGAPAPTVAPGDVVTLTGFITDYYGQSELLIGYITEIETTGSTTPTSTELSALPFDWEPYEGVLITVPNLSITSELDGYGAAETSWSDLWIDDMFYDWTVDYGTGDTLSLVTGPVYYSWYEYRVLPRSADDLVP